MSKKLLVIKLVVFLIVFNFFSLSFCYASEFLKKNDTSIFIKMEPAILGVYTNGNEITVFLSCQEIENKLTKISGTIQFSNLTFVKAHIGSMFDPKYTKIETKPSGNNLDILITGKGKTEKMSNINSIAVLVFKANKPGTARFWFKNGKIIDDKKENLKYYFLPSSIKIVDPKGITISLNVGKREYSVNGEVEYFSQEPIIFKNRTLIPLRSIAEKMGAKVEWIKKSKKILISLGDINIEMKVGNFMVVINGQSRYLDVPPLIINDKTFIPLRYISETLGGKVTWNNKAQKIEIFF